jgi:hypothetical protein
MLEHEFDETIHQSWNASCSWHRLPSAKKKSVAKINEDLLDEVPVMPATILCLEMLLREPLVDLKRVSEIILSDVGATIQILRLIGEGYDFDEERPRRMGDCLASLEVGTWFAAISARTYVCDREHAETTELWKHCRLVGQCAQLAADWLECVSGEDAYLVGLLHGIGAIPSVLGWPGGPGVLFGMEGALPAFVFNAMRSPDDSSLSSDWRFILSVAQELAGPRLELAAA